jgi:hypothetical protein
VRFIFDLSAIALPFFLLALAQPHARPAAVLVDEPLRVVRNERDFLLFIAALIFYNLLRHDILCGFSDEISGSAASARCNESHKI